MGVSVWSRPLTRRSLPKKISFLLIPKVGVSFNMFVIIQRLKLTIFIEAIKGVFIVLNMINKHHAVGVVDLVLNTARYETVGAKADFVAVFIERFDANFSMARDFAVDRLYA